MFVGLVWLTSNHMFGSGDFGDKSPSWFLKILKLPSFYLGNFKIFKKALRQFISFFSPKHVITSTNNHYYICNQCSLLCSNSLWYMDKTCHPHKKYNKKDWNYLGCNLAHFTLLISFYIPLIILQNFWFSDICWG